MLFSLLSLYNNHLHTYFYDVVRMNIVFTVLKAKLKNIIWVKWVIKCIIIRKVPGRDGYSQCYCSLFSIALIALSFTKSENESRGRRWEEEKIWIVFAIFFFISILGKFFWKGEKCCVFSMFWAFSFFWMINLCFLLFFVFVFRMKCESMDRKSIFFSQKDWFCIFFYIMWIRSFIVIVAWVKDEKFNDEAIFTFHFARSHWNFM